MTVAEIRRYRFATRAQWSATLIAGATLVEEGLAIPAPLRWTAVAGTDASDATPAIDYDICGRLMWVRQATRQLFRLSEAGVQNQGRLLDGGRPRALVTHAGRLWLLDDHSLNLYVERNLQLLSEVAAGRSILAIASDRRDGVWSLEGGDDRPASLVNHDRRGRRAPVEIQLGHAIDTAAMASTRCGRFIAILDRSMSRRGGCCCEGEPWGLLIVDTCTPTPRTIPGLFTREPFFSPSLIVIDKADLVHLVDARNGRLLTLNLSGDVLAEGVLGVPDAALPLQGIAATSSFAIAGATGTLVAERTTDDVLTDLDITATIITPTLISPEGPGGGWQRADIDVLLPEGTTLTVSPATTRDPALAAEIAQIFADQTRSPAAKTAAVDQRLSGAWEPERSVVFAAAPGQPRVRLYYALHEIETPYLWLKLALHAPPGRRQPSLRRLDVLYPNISYLEYLPAVYRRDTRSVAQLRRFLALFEGLFDDLDAVIDRLPQSINPATAAEEWLPLLLTWLGFPALPGLPPPTARALLEHASDLLAGRGIIGTLEQLLRIVTGRSVTVEDAAAGPPPWVLPATAGVGEPPRLGRDTLILEHEAAPKPFALAWSATLGKVPLGQQCQPEISAFARQVGSLIIRIAAPPAEGQLAEWLETLLPSFVPAHCRYRIVYERAGSLTQRGRLGRDIRLAGDREITLGTDFILGRRRLPAQPTDGAVLNRTSGLDGNLHLS